jgi:hypothetical protein
MPYNSIAFNSKTMPAIKMDFKILKSLLRQGVK